MISVQGRDPLIALLTRRIHPWDRPAAGISDTDERWGSDGGPSIRLMCRIYGIAPSDDYVHDVPRIARLRGARDIAASNLPDLVTFAGINDPKTVIEVDPKDLQATLGPGVSWNDTTLESTDEPITTGIKQHLPLLSAYYNGMLDGHRYRDSNTLANSLSTADFDQTGDLVGSK